MEVLVLEYPHFKFLGINRVHKIHELDIRAGRVRTKGSCYSIHSTNTA